MSTLRQMGWGVGLDVFELALYYPHMIQNGLSDVRFKGPYAYLWRALVLDKLPGSIERWRKTGPCRNIYKEWRWAACL